MTILSTLSRILQNAQPNINSFSSPSLVPDFFHRVPLSLAGVPLSPPSTSENPSQLSQNPIFQSGNPKVDTIVLKNMSAVLDRVFLDVELSAHINFLCQDPFIFSPYHKALRQPFDYYTFGQNYIQPLVDFSACNIIIFYGIHTNNGRNIVLISNHQTEADPAVIALLLEATNPRIVENITYVAGDRVLTDPLCKPFSMGRFLYALKMVIYIYIYIFFFSSVSLKNLICVYSKKNMNDVPELVEMKRKAHTRSLKEMALLLRGGSQIIWIAPSGGRDRPDLVTGEWHPRSGLYPYRLSKHLPPSNEVVLTGLQRKYPIYLALSKAIAPVLTYSVLKSRLVRCRYASHLISVDLESHVLELEISSPTLKLGGRCYSYRPLSFKQHS
ncbi:hypothetical protein UlMin_001018 [Ulmus minor]